jgi:DNA-binding phage protein
MNDAKTVMAIEEIVKRLERDNVSRVSRETGLTRPTVYSVRDGNTGVRYDTIKTLSDYYRALALEF